MMESENLPQHVAIIMDGNGRWAKSRHLPRTSGHIEGVKRVEEIVYFASARGIKVLTLFTFSTENWSRPKQEVSMLMRMLITVLNKKIQELNKKNIRLRLIGRKEGVPQSVLKTILSATELTKNNDGMILNMAFNYGGRLEILDAVKTIAAAVKNNEMQTEDITEDTLNQLLYTKGLPDPDLLIRTSGEKRISNFLLWQLSYSEFYFTDKFWPDFNKDEFEKALTDFKRRERRYGKVTAN
ncbi:MAG TPA: isoprenyl transferase [Candidatus Omnitrophota bacterium]|nr:isoprenyl transferase [Candidatus Omnitrophota bacterium]